MDQPSLKRFVMWAIVACHTLILLGSILLLLSSIGRRSPVIESVLYAALAACALFLLINNLPYGAPGRRGR
jgi:hypothetical protein